MYIRDIKSGDIMPYSYNLNKPLWDPSNFTFNNFSPAFMPNNTFDGMQMPWFGTSSTSSDSSTSTDSYESWKQ